MTLLFASALKSCLVLVPALAAGRLARTAAVRHVIVATAIGCAAALPMASLVMPHWSVALLLGSGAAAVSARWLTPVESWLLPAWATGAALCVTVIVIRLVQLVRVTARCDQVTGALADLALDISAASRVPRPVTLLRSGNGSLLGTWGIDPKVILPAQADSWEANRLAVVLRHELAHVRRRDWLIQTGADVARAIYWFNPLMWIACRELRRASEHACDAAVVGSGVDAREYAAHLVDIARALRPQDAWWPVAAMTHGSGLERHVRAILQMETPRLLAVPHARRATIVAMTTFTLVLAAIGRPARPGRIIVPHPRAQRLTLMLDGQIVDVSRGWPSPPDPNAGLVPGHGTMLSVATNR